MRCKTPNNRFPKIAPKRRKSGKRNVGRNKRKTNCVKICYFKLMPVFLHKNSIYAVRRHKKRHCFSQDIW
jgi:hypothetical protein